MEARCPPAGPLRLARRCPNSRGRSPAFPAAALVAEPANEGAPSGGGSVRGGGSRSSHFPRGGYALESQAAAHQPNSPPPRLLPLPTTAPPPPHHRPRRHVSGPQYAEPGLPRRAPPGAAPQPTPRAQRGGHRRRHGVAPPRQRRPASSVCVRALRATNCTEERPGAASQLNAALPRTPGCCR